MTAGEQQAEPLVADLGEAVGHGIDQIRGLFRDRIQTLVGGVPPAQPVDGAVARHREQPGRRGIRRLVPPPLERQRDRVLKRVLGQFEVAEPVDERGQHPDPMFAVGILDGVLRHRVESYATVIVRRARAADVDAAARAVAAVAEEGFLGAQPPVDLDERAERFREVMERGDPAGLWVLEDDDGRVVGHAAVQESVPGVLSIGMAILPEARGKGGGRALVAAVQEHARAVNAHKISLEVWTDNARAISLYAAAGFEVEGLRRDHYRRRDGRLRSTLIMAWRVDAP